MFNIMSYTDLSLRCSQSFENATFCTRLAALFNGFNRAGGFFRKCDSFVKSFPQLSGVPCRIPAKGFDDLEVCSKLMSGCCLSCLRIIASLLSILFCRSTV